MATRDQIRDTIALKVIAIAKAERLLKLRTTRLHQQKPDSAAENDAALARRQAQWNLDRKRQQLSDLWTQYDEAPA